MGAERTAVGLAGAPGARDDKWIHYHLGYIGEDSGPAGTIDPDSAGSTLLNNGVAYWGRLLVQKR